MSLILRAAAVTDVGLVRTNNEDSAHAGRRLIAVADGIGGLPAGEFASDIVMRALAPLEDAPAGDDPLAELTGAVYAANRQIREMTESTSGRDGMGTTVTALLLSGEDLGMFHVGDSRAYLLRDDELTQVTKDDTFVQSLVDQGLLTRDEARRHPQRSLVTQALQGQPFTPTSEVLRPRAGDRYLLCSDGLSDYVDDEAIGRCLSSSTDPQHSAEALVKLAIDAGAPDNVTVVVADVATG